MRLPLLLNGSLLVNSEFCENESPVVSEGLETDEIGAGDPFPHSQLCEKLRTVMSGIRPNDGEAAKVVRSLLDITRRDAAEPKLWHYCSVIICPAYVAWRWRDEGKRVPRNRYLGSWERNAVGRLWWLAELTMDRKLDDPYASTLKAGTNQEFSLWCLDSSLAANPTIMSAMISVCFDDEDALTGEQIREVFKKITAIRATRNLDLLAGADILSLVRMTASQITGSTNAKSAAAK